MTPEGRGGADAPKPTKKNQPLLLLLGCAGCGFLLLLAGVGGAMGWLLWQQQRASSVSLPAGWRDSIRAVYRLPDEVARLAPPPSDDGDASAWLTVPRDSAAATRRLRAVRSLGPNAAPTADDSATISGMVRDPGVDSSAAAARRLGYQPLGRLADQPGRPRLMPPLGPGLVAGGTGVSRAADRLILRGEARRWRRDFTGARGDFSAAVALGRLAWTSELSDVGPLIGRRVLRGGAEGLARLAAQTRDTSLARDAEALRAWAAGPAARDRWSFQLPPDSLVLLAQDGTLPRGVRASTLEWACQRALYQPLWRMFTGPSRTVLDGVRQLAHDPDPVVARAAVMADSTLHRIDGAGIGGRWRMASGRRAR